MKRILSTAALVAPLLLAAPAVAGDYHRDATLRCAQCHIMHYSESHGGPSWSYTANLGAAGPYHYLLRDDINNLCLSCHDNNPSAPDVYGATNTGNSPTDVRLGGFLNELGDGNEEFGHTLNSTDTAPGGTFANADGLNCTDCHHQHSYAGYGHPDGNNYRNLVGGGAFGFVTYNWASIPANDLTKDVFERAPATYDESFVDWNEPDTTASAIAGYCAGCHGDFHGVTGGTQVGGVGGSGAWNEFVRHPSAEVNIGDLGGGHSSLGLYVGTEHTAASLTKTTWVKVMSANEGWGSAAVANDATPTCISCHKAHGNGNPFGLIYRQSMGTLTENGDTNGNQLEDLCGQCHVQAEYFALNP